MRIIFSDKGGCSIMTPTPDFLSSLPADWSDEEKMIHVANKDLPSETKYEIVDEVPSDRTFRDAWEYTSGPGERTAE